VANACRIRKYTKLCFGKSLSLAKEGTVASKLKDMILKVEKLQILPVNAAFICNFNICQIITHAIP